MHVGGVCRLDTPCSWHSACAECVHQGAREPEERRRAKQSKRLSTFCLCRGLSAPSFAWLTWWAMILDLCSVGWRFISTQSPLRRWRYTCTWRGGEQQSNEQNRNTTQHHRTTRPTRLYGRVPSLLGVRSWLATACRSARSLALSTLRLPYSSYGVVGTGGGKRGGGV